MLAVLPHRAHVAHPRGGYEQRRRRVAVPERRELLELLRKRCAESVARHDGVDPLLGDQVVGREHRRGVGDERLAEPVHCTAVDLEAGRRAMAAEAAQVLRAGPQPGVQVERPDAAAGAAAAVAVEGDDHARPVVALDHPRRDDPDHARVPALARQHVRRRLGVLRARGLGLEQDARLRVPPLAVEEVELVGHVASAALVLGEQELE
jgi:hypothetical protein